MKKIAAYITVMIASFACADVNDAIVSFSTRGPDRYADGTIVMDGECYALVWSTDGVFEGLSANGEPVDSNDRVVLIAPYAKDGRCPEVLFQIPDTLAATLANGVYDVLLLDTRVTCANGKVAPYGTSNGGLKVVNGYGGVAEGIAIAKTTSGALNAGTNAEVSGGVVASTGAVAPKGIKQPRIKHIRIDGDNVFLTVENLPGFMRIQGGTTPSASDTTDSATATDGGASDVVLVTKKTGNSGFFRVVRN